jgi:hypothetical protein
MMNGQSMAKCCPHFRTGRISTDDVTSGRLATGNTSDEKTRAQNAVSDNRRNTFRGTATRLQSATWNGFHHHSGVHNVCE